MVWEKLAQEIAFDAGMGLRKALGTQVKARTGNADTNQQLDTVPL